MDVIQLLKEQLPPQQDEGSLLLIDIRQDFVLQDAPREGRKEKFTTNTYGSASHYAKHVETHIIIMFMN